MCHVLIIEDDAIAAFDIRGTLKAAGATSFEIAATEREAIDRAREIRPSVITSDVMLEKGSGPDAVIAIQAEFGPIPVIFITATPDQCERAAQHRILEKPFDPVQLAAAFREIAPI